MNNYILVGIILLVLGVGVYLFVSGHSPSEEAPGGNQNIRILLDNGRISPKQIDVSSQWPVIFIVHNFSNSKHDLVIKKLDAEGNEGEALRSFELEGSDAVNIRMKLDPGDYLIYCTISQGERSHRKDGEEAKIIVH